MKLNGRVIFRMVHPFLKIISSLLRLFPQNLQRFIWSLSSPFEGFFSVGLRYSLICAQCKAVGNNVFIGSNVTIKNHKFLSLGNNVSIHTGVYVDAIGGIDIRDNVSIAHQSSLVSFNHTWKDVSTAIKYNEISLAQIVIMDDVWIGCGVRILAGVNIAGRTVVTAGAVVTRGSYISGIYGGVPARSISSF